MSSPEPLLNDILDYIEKAEAAIAARDTVALEGMNSMVDDVCARVVMLSADMAREYAPEIDHLKERIVQMQQQMAALQGDVLTSITSLTSTKKAANAYEKNQPEA